MEPCPACEGSGKAVRVVWDKLTLQRVPSIIACPACAGRGEVVRR